MSKIICSMILLLISQGCAATTPKATFIHAADKNILSLAGCRLLIDKRFVMVGEIDKALDQVSVDRMVGGSVSRSHLFADSTDGKDMIRRAFVVIETHLTSHTSIYQGESSYSGHTARHVDKGMTDRLGTRCAYLIREVGSIYKPILDLMKEKGFAVDPDAKKGVEVAFAKTTGRSSRLNFYYIEAGDESQANAVFENAVHFIRFEM